MAAQGGDVAVAALIGGYYPFRCLRGDDGGAGCHLAANRRTRPEAGKASIHRIPEIRFVRMRTGRAHMVGRPCGW